MRHFSHNRRFDTNTKPNTVVKKDNNNEKITGKQDNQTGASCWYSCDGYKDSSLESADWIFICVP